VAGEIVLEAIGVDHEDDPRAPLVHEPRDALLAVSGYEEVQTSMAISALRRSRAWCNPSKRLGLTLVEPGLLTSAVERDLKNFADGEDADDVGYAAATADVRRHLLDSGTGVLWRSSRPRGWTGDGEGR
jgi:hypothetical protein